MRVYCSSSHVDLEGEVIDPENADLDGTFKLRCADTGEVLSVNGWLFIIEEIKDAPADPADPAVPLLA